MMQFLARDYDGMADTARRMIQAKPSAGGNWHAFAAAMHLTGHDVLAGDILGVWVQMEEDATPGFYNNAAHATVEKTHLHLFLATLAAKGSGPEAALAHLAKFEPIILDKVALAEARARLYVSLAQHDKAADTYRQLLDINVENLGYFEGLRAALHLPAESAPTPLSDAQCTSWLATIDAVAAKHPRAALPSRLALRCLAASDGVAHDTEFERRAELMARSVLRKGVAAGFVVLHDAARRAPRRLAQLTALADRYVTSLRADGRLPPLADDKQSGQLESPAVLFWALFFRARCAEAHGDVTATLDWLAQAEKHTPTVIELFSYRALVYKRAGNAALAFEQREKARSMDLADRYLNTKSAKYALRAGKRDEATKLLALFTKSGDDPERYMHEMQCTWFELEAAQCHFAKQELGRALYHFSWVDKHTDEIATDQQDFFGYCFRKVTLQAFVDFTDFQNRLRGGHAWQSAAAGIIRTYLLLADRAAVAAKAQAQADAEFEALPAAERKKLQAKKRKAEANAEPAAPAAGKAKASAQDKPPLENAPKPPAELEQCAEPLAEASRWAHRLVNEAATSGAFVNEAHRLALVAQTRAGRLLLAMRSARHALAAGGSGDAEVERDVLLLLDAIDRAAANTEAPLAPAVASVLASTRAELPGGGVVATRLAALSELARAEASLALAAVRDVAADIAASGAALASCAYRGTRIECERWLRALRAVNAVPATIDVLLASARKRYPLASAFDEPVAEPAEESPVATEAAK